MATMLRSTLGCCSQLSFRFNRIFLNKTRISIKDNQSASLHTSARTLADDGIAACSPSAVGFNDYEKEKREFTLTPPEYYNFAVDVIDGWAQREAERNGLPAFWWVGEDRSEVKWSFSDLSWNSRKVANILRGPCKLELGDRLMIIMSKDPSWWLFNIAAIRSGVVLIPATTQVTAKDIRLRLGKSGVRVVVCTPDIADRVDEIEPEFPGLLKTKLLVGSKEKRPGWLSYEELFNTASPEFTAVKTRSDDTMTIFFTSGTTGYPKMCEHTHASYGLGHYISGKYWMDLCPRDVHWALSDTGWAKAAWANLFAPWIHGACVFINASPKFDPEETLQMLGSYPVSTFCAPPTGYRFMIQQQLNKYKFPDMRHFISAGEPLNPEVTETWYDGTDFTIREGYGQTETVLLSASYRCIKNKPGSMGKPSPGMDVRIIDSQGNEVAEGVEGDIALRVKPERPAGLFRCYVDDPDLTKACHTGDFYVTGDRAYRDEEDYLWFVGRSDDVIITSGYRIGPFEVESALIEHPAVAESAIVSSPDKTRGEVIKAFVVLSDSHKDSDKEGLVKDIQNHVKTHTAPYKYPRKVEFVETLPKTISGKIRRIQLRNQEWGRTEN